MVKHFRELRVYQEAFELAGQIYELSKGWPKDEKYALTDQIRRSSRSVCANLAEAWRKRRYPKHFINKISDADAEAAETQCWLDFAVKCGYIDQELYKDLNLSYEKVIGGLVLMMKNVNDWSGPSRVREAPTKYIYPVA